MNRKLHTLFVALLITMLAVSPVYAGGVSGRIGLGSITFDGTAWGFGKDATIYIDAVGTPLTNCYAPGNDNPAPGQNPPKISASDSQPASDGWLGKGKFEVHLSADANFAGWTAETAGCPNNNWGFQVYFVKWESVTITVVDAKTNTRYQQNYSCVTTYIPDYTPGDDNTFNDGTIECTVVP